MWRIACRSKVLILLVRRLGYLSMLGVCLLAAACGESRVVQPVPTQTQPELTPPSPPPVNTAVLAGAYALTVEFSSACATIPELAVPREYEMRLEAATPYPYLVIRITGGGYTTPTAVGDLWPSQDGHAARVSWNNFDIGGCDGFPEPLSNGRALMVCGEGWATINDRTVLAPISGDVFIEADGRRQKVCDGVQRFTFTRIAP